MQHKILKIHVIACDRISFLPFVRLNNILLHVYTTFCLFVCEHLGCLHLSAIVNNAALNMGVNITSRSCFQFSWTYTQKWDRWITWQLHF